MFGSCINDRVALVDRYARPFGCPQNGLAGACLFAGAGFLTVADAGWAHAIGVAFLLGFIISGLLAAAPAEVAKHPALPGGPPI